MRRVPKGSPEINAKLQHIILDGEMRVFVELTKDIKMGDEFVLEHFIPQHLDQELYKWEEERDDYFVCSFDLLQDAIFGQAPQLIYDKLNDHHPFLQAKRCLWDYVIIGDITQKGHPCFGQRGCFARVPIPKGNFYFIFIFIFLFFIIFIFIYFYLFLFIFIYFYLFLFLFFYFLFLFILFLFIFIYFYLFLFLF